MEVTARNAPDALYEVGMRMKVSAVEEETRNGPVWTIPEPLMLTILNPRERVLTEPARDANPFFHIAEAVWMLGGGQGLEFVEYYNSGMNRYSDDGATLHGAYGHRWRKHFFRDQIADVIDMLVYDPSTRRAVIGIWDSEVDHKDSLDIPCNTQINFRVVEGQLDMTVLNRSNDVVWGMLGANVVHMTYLHELVAFGAGLSMGRYRVVTTNAHTYRANPYTVSLLGATGPHDTYMHRGCVPYALGHSGENYTGLLAAFKMAVAFPWETKYASEWLRNVFIPARDAYKLRKEGKAYEHRLKSIVADDWRLACVEWCARRDN